ncbi:MAG: hypothetical protein WBA23_10970 [Tunicatimonas sp.]|uniref:hypothetical protein n=1 Tax=Tunicatimonas sp. TaxID=1940096 RepID=UPI003C744C39
MFQNSVLESYDGSDATWEIIIMLLIAFVLGYILRQILSSSKARRLQELEYDNRHLAGRVKELERSVSKEKRDVIRLTEDLNNCRQESASTEQMSALENSLADLRQQNSQLQSELSLCLASKKEPEPADSELNTDINPIMTTSDSTTVTVEAPPIPDNLKVVEGIGPKIERMLNAEGIYTFSQLASADNERLRNIMALEGHKFLAVHNPASWPKQAQLAANENWEGLESYKGQLKSGREVK